MNIETCRKQFALDNLAWLDLKTVKNYNLAVKQLIEHTESLLRRSANKISRPGLLAWRKKSVNL